LQRIAGALPDRADRSHLLATAAAAHLRARANQLGR
jgi:hypothetical protein